LQETSCHADMPVIAALVCASDDQRVRISTVTWI
jgi:hypothetical protein